MGDTPHFALRHVDKLLPFDLPLADPDAVNPEEAQSEIAQRAIEIFAYFRDKLDFMNQEMVNRSGQKARKLKEIKVCV